MNEAFPSPIGAFENSPAIYRRERNDKIFFVPSGRLNQRNQASLQDAIFFAHVFPALKCRAIFHCPYRTLKTLNRSVYVKLAHMPVAGDRETGAGENISKIEMANFNAHLDNTGSKGESSR